MIILHIVGWLLLLVGCFAIFSGVIGLFRFTDFFTKLHAAGVIDSFGLPVSLIGLSCLQTNFLSSFKLIFATILILILSPIATHALAKAALSAQLRSKNLQLDHKNMEHGNVE